MRLIQRWPKVDLLRTNGEDHYHIRPYALCKGGFKIRKRGGAWRPLVLTVSVVGLRDRMIEPATPAPVREGNGG